MNLKHLLIAGAVLALSATTANAANLMVLATPYAPTNQVLDINFDTPGTPYDLSGDIAILSASIPGVSAAPAGDSTNFASVPFEGSSGSGTIMFGPVAGGLQSIRGFGFLLGSVDTYNHFDLLDPLGNTFFSFSGADLAPANGDQSVSGNRNVYVALADNEILGGMRVTGTSYAAEFDNLVGGVPEPATWAMMIMGFGMMGAMLRRRHPALQQAA